MTARRKPRLGDKKRRRNQPGQWIEGFMHESFVRAAIPVGPLRFQANIPICNDLDDNNHHSDDLKWLGTQTWPLQGVISEKSELDVIGKGRPEKICQCVSPGSMECVKHHIAQKVTQLQIDLGPAFYNWKFDEMGEEAVSRLWSLHEQKSCEALVKGNSESKGIGFSELAAMENLTNKSKQNIVSYYLNVHVPKRISNQTMKGLVVVDSDDEETETRRISPSKHAKAQFLSGQR